MIEYKVINMVQVNVTDETKFYGPQPQREAVETFLEQENVANSLRNSEYIEEDVEIKTVDISLGDKYNRVRLSPKNLATGTQFDKSKAVTLTVNGEKEEFLFSLKKL